MRQRKLYLGPLTDNRRWDKVRIRPDDVFVVTPPRLGDVDSSQFRKENDQCSFELRGKKFSIIRLGKDSGPLRRLAASPPAAADLVWPAISSLLTVSC